MFWELLLGATKAVPFLGWTSPCSSASHSKIFQLWIASVVQFIDTFPVPELPKMDSLWSYCLHGYWREGIIIALDWLAELLFIQNRMQRPFVTLRATADPCSAYSPPWPQTFSRSCQLSSPQLGSLQGSLISQELELAFMLLELYKLPPAFLGPSGWQLCPWVYWHLLPPTFGVICRLLANTATFFKSLIKMLKHVWIWASCLE